jgi:copper ion binding protein
MHETATLRVTGMTCGGCENAVKRAVGQLDGVAEVAASHEAEEVVVTYDAARVGPEAIAAKIQRLGYQVVPN